MKQIPIDFREVVESTVNITRNKLVKHYGVSPPVIDRWVKDTGVLVGSVCKDADIDINQFSIDVQSNTMTQLDIAKKYHMDASTVPRVCKRNNIEPNMKRLQYTPRDDFELMTSLLFRGKASTARFYSTTISAINGWCNANSFTVPKYHGRRNRVVDSMSDTVVNLYNQDHTISFISSLLDSNSGKIKRVLQDRGINIVTQQDKWAADRLSIANNFESYVECNRQGKDLIQISEDHGISYEQLKREFWRRNHPVTLHSYNKSKGELDLIKFITDLGVVAESRKWSYGDKTFEIDCMIPHMSLGIEYCGEYWHSTQGGKQRKYHQQKYEWCKDQGINLITLFEHEWYTKRPLLENMIKYRLGLCPNRVFARKTELAEISSYAARKFHDVNHISGGISASSINMGLHNQGELVSVISLSKSRYSDHDFELIRYSTKQGVSVVGGFGKLFKGFTGTCSPGTTILSYCDLRFGSGGVYDATGFIYSGTTPPNYWYYYKNAGPTGRFESRIKYQKHKLKSSHNYDALKTEEAIMSENGYLRVYDCGSSRHVYTV